MADNLKALKIKANLLADKHIGLLDIGVEVHEGTALLTGKVETEEQRQTAEKLAFRATGVYEVVDEISVIPNSLSEVLTCSLQCDSLACEPSVTPDGGEIESRLRSKLLSKECQAFADIHVGVSACNLIKLDGCVPREADLRELHSIVLSTDGVIGIDSGVSVTGA